MKISKQFIDHSKSYSVLTPVRLVVLTSIMLFASACEEEDDDKGLQLDTFKATLSGANETPPNESTATGTATLTYNKVSRILTVIVDYTGLTVTAAQIQKGAEGVAGENVATFTITGTSPIGYSTEITKDQEKDLYDGLYYVNLYSELYPAGEIRGQLTKQ